MQECRDRGWCGRVGGQQGSSGGPTAPPLRPHGAAASVSTASEEQERAGSCGGGSGGTRAPWSCWFSSVICRLETHGNCGPGVCPCLVAPGGCRDAGSQDPVCDSGTQEGAGAEAARGSWPGRGEAHQPYSQPCALSRAPLLILLPPGYPPSPRRLLPALTR